MSDSRLRELERRWRENAGVNDESAYLLECVRSGVISYDQLSRLARIGLPAARRALANAFGRPVKRADTLFKLLDRFQRERVYVLAALAAADYSARIWRETNPESNKHVLRVYNAAKLSFLYPEWATPATVEALIRPMSVRNLPVGNMIKAMNAAACIGSAFFAVLSLLGLDNMEDDQAFYFYVHARPRNTRSLAYRCVRFGNDVGAHGSITQSAAYVRVKIAEAIRDDLVGRGQV